MAERKRRDAGGVAMFSLWEFANEIDNPKNDDLVTIDKPNATNVEKTKSSVCLLEIADSVDFGKKNTPVRHC